MESGDGVSNETGVYYVGDFDEELGEKLLPELDAEFAKRKGLRNPGSITLFINSHGGYTRVLFDVLAKVELLKAIGVTVKTVVAGYAYSCGALLAMAGTPGHRYTGPYAEFLLHMGSASTGRVETPLQLERSAERVARHFATVETIIKRYARVPQLRSKLKDDNLFFDAEQAIAWGVVDKLLY